MHTPQLKEVKTRLIKFEICLLKMTAKWQITEEPRYHVGPRDWQNVFGITRFRCIKVLFHIFYYLLKPRKSFVIPMTLYGGSLNRGSIVIARNSCCQIFNTERHIRYTTSWTALRFTENGGAMSHDAYEGDVWIQKSIVEIK